MREPLLSSTGKFFPIWSGFVDPSLRPALMIARDGSGYRPVDIGELGTTAIASGLNVNITGIVNNEQVTQIAGSGNVDTANKVFVDSQGRFFTLSSQTGIWSVGLTGTNNVTLTNPVSQVSITGQPINVNAGQSGAWTVSLTGSNSITISNPQTQVGITGQPINVNAGQSGSWGVLAAQSGAFTASVAQSGAWSFTELNPTTKVGITGVTGLGADVVLAGGYNSISTIITSGTLTATISNPISQVGITGQPINVNAGQSGAWNVLAAQSGAWSTTNLNPQTIVGISGTTGLAIQVISSNGYNSIPVMITSGDIELGSLSVAQSGAWSVLAAQSGTWNITDLSPQTKVGITGVTGLGVDVVSAGGYNSIPTIITSGTVTATLSNGATKVGITGVTGLGVDVTLAGGYNSLASIVTSGSVTATISNPVSQVSITGQPINVNAGQSGAWNVLAAQSGAFNALVAQSGAWSVTTLNPQTKVGITGTTGLGADVVLAGGYNSISTIVTSGNIDANQKGAWNVSSAQSGTWGVLARQSGEFTALVAQSGAWSTTTLNPQTKVGITGVTGLGVDSALTNGYNSLAVMITSGSTTATISNPQTQVGITGQPINVNAGQSGTWTVSLTGSNSITISNPGTKVGITGVTGLGADVVLAGGYNSLSVIVPSGAVNSTQQGAWNVSSAQSGGWNVLAKQSGEFTALVAQSGAWSFTQLNPQTKVGITGANGSGIDSLLVGNYNSLTVAITSGASNTTNFGITGVTGLGTDVVLAGGYNSIPVIITSGLPSLASGILSSVGISGSTGLLATVTGAYGTNALCVAITSGNSFVRGSGANRGHRITTSGVSQQVAAANANRRYLKVQNIDDTNMWVNYGSVASSGSGSFIIYPAGSDVYEAGFIETGSVNVFGLVAGKQYTIKEA